MRHSIFFLGLVLFLSGTSFAANIYVDALSGNDGWPGTISQPKKTIGAAISAAVNLDEIIVRAGTYNGPDNRNLRPGSKNIVIRSESGKDVTIIDAEGLDRVFYIASAPATAKIKGFTIQNGYSDSLLIYGGGGSGIYIIQSAITIEDCIIKNCTGVEGVGMVIRNSAGTRIVNCIFQNNTAYHASMAAKAAGVSLYLNTDIEFSRCRFISNRVLNPTYHGGAIYLYRYDAAFKNCVFEGNYAYRSGGVAFVEEGSLTFDQCTFAGNSCGGNGGVFWIGYMGAAHEVTCRNSIFRNNSAVGDGEVAFLNGVGVAGGIFRYGYCDINSSDIYRGGTGGTTVQNLGGNIYADPYFVTLGYWDGGAAMWISGDYHLQSKAGRFDMITGGWVQDNLHSPCIDAGNPADAVGDEPEPNGGVVNMGAYGATDEASKSPYCQSTLSADLNHDCYVNLTDFAEMASQWLRCDIQPQSFCQ